jgi:two-component sensor histidine kinase
MSLLCLEASASEAQPLYLVEEITHRVLNEYTETIGWLSLAAASAPDQVCRATLESAARRLQIRAEAHRALQAPLDDQRRNLSDHVAVLCARLAGAQLAEHPAQVTVSAEEVWLDARNSWRVGLIIAELVRNAMKHGRRGPGCAIRVEVGEASGGRIWCCVADNGTGGSIPSTGRGRALVQTLAADLGGLVDWRFTPGGCVACLEFARPDLP